MGFGLRVVSDEEMLGITICELGSMSISILPHVTRRNNIVSQFQYSDKYYKK